MDADSPTDVPWDEVKQGCPQRDCIPSLDRPKVVAAADADFLDDEDLVLALDRGGVRWAYPTRILNYHEIVNDTVAGTPIAITYCPLCGSGVAFRRVPRRAASVPRPAARSARCESAGFLAARQGTLLSCRRGGCHDWEHRS